MTEAHPIRESYEQVRDSVSDTDVRAAWRDGDRFTQHYLEESGRIQEDSELTQEGKDRKTAELYQRVEGRITSSYKTAREKARSIAKSSFGSSVPMPDGKTLATSKVQDSAELLALSSEVDAVRALVNTPADKLPDKMKKKDGASGVLKHLYEEAMEAGDIEGGVRARAVLRVAEEKGMHIHDVVAPFMNDRHRSALERHRRYELIARTIPSSSYPKPSPFETGAPMSTPASLVGTYGARDKLVIGREKGQMFKSARAPYWK